LNRIRCSYILAAVILILLSIPQPSHSQNNDLEMAKKLNQRATQLYKDGRYAEAIPITKEILSIREKVLGPEHPDVAYI